MFVFIGLRPDHSQVNLDNVLEELNKKSFNENTLDFTRKEDLILSHYDDAGFYITFPKSKDEISDFVELANDFELTVDLTAATKEELNKRYEKLKKDLPELYEDSHYSIAKEIFDVLNKIPGISILTFQ
jgi:hypothetical protein